MRAIFEVGFTFGWRLHELIGEHGLHVEQVNLSENIIRLNPGETKNDDAREVEMTATVRELLSMCVHGKTRKDPVFTRGDGEPVIDFRKAWHAVCIRAGLGELVCPDCDEPVDEDRHCALCGRDWKANRVRYRGLLFHDLRRTAVRNMVRAGIPEKVAMTISGHRTRAIFDRYHIVAPNDLREAARRLETNRQLEREAMQKSHASDFGQGSGMIAQNPVQTPEIAITARASATLPN